MKEVILNNKNYLLVEIPDSARRFEITTQTDVIETRYYLWAINMVTLYLTTNVKPKIIGKVSDILKDEEICKGLVELANEQMVDTGNKLHYKDHRSASWELDYDKATDSFKSWLESIELDTTKQYLLIQQL